MMKNREYEYNRDSMEVDSSETSNLNAIVSERGIIDTDGIMHANSKKMQKYEIQYTIKNGVLKLSENLDEWDNQYLRKELRTLIVKEGVTTIGRRAFFLFEQLRSVTFPNTMLAIEDLAFSNTRLSSITIPDSVTSIGKEAFSDCKHMTRVICGEFLERIEEGAFSSCDRLRYVELHSKLKHIGDRAFCGCESLRSISLSDNLEFLGERAFAGCGLRTVVIPKTVTTIKDNVFSDCNRLRSATIYNSFTSVGYEVFPERTKIVRVE